MEEKPKISVIAPCLNEEKHLPTFLNSLANQTFKNFEVILVDGDSIDNTKNIIIQFKKNLDVKVVIDKTRNFGYIRNLGAKYSIGSIMLHCNTDNYLEPYLLEKLNQMYEDNPKTVSIGGRVFPMGTSIIEHISYQLFDFLRFIFTCAPIPIKKYRPSGNFMSMRSHVFWEIGGHPEVCANEDGLLGQKLDVYANIDRKVVIFTLKLYMGHYVKKFKQMGGVKAILFYFYVLGNFFPMLKPLLKPIENQANLTFAGEQATSLTVKQLIVNFWDWL